MKLKFMLAAFLFCGFSGIKTIPGKVLRKWGAKETTEARKLLFPTAGEKKITRTQTARGMGQTSARASRCFRFRRFIFVESCLLKGAFYSYNFR